MRGIINFNLTYDEGRDKLERYRLAAARRRLVSHPLRTRLARALYHLAEQLEPAQTATQLPAPAQTTRLEPR